jgi:oligosaccharide reducing-end xylanase
MKKNCILTSMILITLSITGNKVNSQQPVDLLNVKMNEPHLFIAMAESIHQKAARSQPDSVYSSKQAGAYYCGKYPNLFSELLGKSPSQVKTKLDNAWDQLFYGDNNTERLYYPVDSDMAYIKECGNNDVRSEGISYGMMIAVQLNKKREFDSLWKWAKRYMQHTTGLHKSYFAWQLHPDGTIIDPNPASDGEEWFVMALFFAAARWGNGTGIYNYKAEAQVILNAMLEKESNPDSDTSIMNIFNKREKQVVFVPIGTAADFTDPSYHLPHFYELWARWADKNNDFWCDAASTSRRFFKNAAHPKTGLMPDYSDFDGKPVDPWNGGHDDFRFDAWRVAMNIAVDYLWFTRDIWAVEQSNRLLEFFFSKGIDTYSNQYTLDGTRLSPHHSTGLIAMNAVAALASTNKNRTAFIQALWEVSIPSGKWRYYDGLLYMLGLLNVSGNFKIYDPTGTPFHFCSPK